MCKGGIREDGVIDEVLGYVFKMWIVKVIRVVVKNEVREEWSVLILGRVLWLEDLIVYYYEEMLCLN